MLGSGISNQTVGNDGNWIQSPGLRLNKPTGSTGERHVFPLLLPICLASGRTHIAKVAICLGVSCV